MLRAMIGAMALGLMGGAATAQTVVPPPQMSVAEGVQLIGVAGFRIAGNGLVNICGTPATPKVTYSDLNGDGRPEAIARDNNPSCYGGAGDWFTVVAKGSDGRWRGIMRSVGTVAFEPTRTAGWLDARVTEDCPRIWKYAGDGYRMPPAWRRPSTRRRRPASRPPIAQPPCARQASSRKAADGWAGKATAKRPSIPRTSAT